MSTNNRPKTIFCDIDGTLIEHLSPDKIHNTEAKLLDGTIEKLQDWDRKGYIIILTTGRKESLRCLTQQQLANVGIFYDFLIMGIGGGDRVLINDNKPDNKQACWSINLTRNEGIRNFCFDDLINSTQEYFSALCTRDYEKIGCLIDNDVTLTDWSTTVTGKDAVMCEISKTFSSLSDVMVQPVSIERVGNRVYAQIKISTKNQNIDVLDVIEYSSVGTIKSIVAYRGAST